MAGETTQRTGLAASAKVMPRPIGPVMSGAVWTHEYTTGQLELNDVLEMGYIPAGATLLGFHLFYDDLDSNGSATLAQKITLGSTDVKTGVTTGQTGGGTTVIIEPVTVTTKTLVKVTNTAAAATAVAGTFAMVPIYIPG